MIRYYLERRTNPTERAHLRLLCGKTTVKYVLEHMDELVIKAANESGGYGILIGPHATDEERAAYAQKIKDDPRNFVAQPTLALSRAPTLIGESLGGQAR